MYNINNSDDLRHAIQLLEKEVDEQKLQAHEQLNSLFRTFDPVTVVKNVFSEVVTSEEFRANILTATMGISTGYITKKLLFKKNHNPLKSLLGNLVQYGLANLIIHPSRTLQTIFLPLLGLILNKGGKKPQQYEKQGS
jgi:hypothetical protein